MRLQDGRYIQNAVFVLKDFSKPKTVAQVNCMMQLPVTVKHYKIMITHNVINQRL